MEFFMAMIPPTVTAQEHKVKIVYGRPVFYDPPEVRRARLKLLANLAAHTPKEKMRGAVELVTKWCFPCTGTHRDGEYRISRPDTDNLQKLLKDCMTNVGFWEDDAQVAREITEKFWADVPGIYIRVTRL